MAKRRTRAEDRIFRPPSVNARLRRLSPTATLGQIARGTGLNVEYVSRIFNRKRTPSLKTATDIAKFLKVSVEKLQEALG